MRENTTLQHSTSSTTQRYYHLEELFQLVAPTWPLAHAVACNPLQGLEKWHFAEATRKGQELFDAACLPGLWQLRQGMENGALRTDDFAEAIDTALPGLPKTLPLGTRRITVRKVLEQLVNAGHDQQVTEHANTLLQQALPYLTEPHPWQPLLPVVNQELVIWLGAFLDEGQAAWGMPYRDEGFFRAVKKLLVHDPAYRSSKGRIQQLPDDPQLALDRLLEDQGVPAQRQQRCLQDHLLALPGWAAFIQWRQQQNDYTPQEKHPINLTDYLAVRLLIASLLEDEIHAVPHRANRELRFLHHNLEAQLNPTRQTDPREWADWLRTIQEAYQKLRLDLLQRWEAHFRGQLGQQIVGQAQKSGPQVRPDAQLAFCIDVRSEPFRRQLEAVGNYETLGFAGFFGLPIAYETILGERVKSLPVLLQPAHELHEVGGMGCSHQVERYRRGKRLLTELKAAYKSLKYNLATPFAAVEALGLPAGLITFGRSLMPQFLIRLRRRGRRFFYPDIDLAPNIHPNNGLGIPLDDQVTYAANALRIMGLTRNFAPLVVLCGHGSQTENNPYAAALDCGACGGSHGGPNAVAMARILNQREVRERLSEQGLEIPADTLFVGAQHNTTTDAVDLYDMGTLEEEKAQQIAALQSSLQEAQRANLRARTAQFGVATESAVLRRSSDWSEVRPEWGLAGNAGFVVAPRHLTTDLDLRGRCFLHSYDWRQDPNGSSLEVILTAPLVVAQWINSQYFFSTTDNVAFGSGSKVTHNVVGKIGVMQGNGSDLMHGLPWQSVMKDDHELYHKPLRLTAMVVAPQARVQALIEKHAILQQMFFNEWVSLQVYDPVAEQLIRLLPNGNWEAV
mgnify:CR=1 FL=1